SPYRDLPYETSAPAWQPNLQISHLQEKDWMELPTLNEINDLIETGFVQTTKRRTISLHPMIQEITLSETKPSVTRCHILLDSLQHICLMYGMEVDYYKKLFQTIGNIIELIEKDDIPKYLLFLENAFPYMDNYNYHKGMNGIIQELKCLLKTKSIGTDSDRALLLDFQATLETKPEKTIKLEKEALHINDSIPQIANYAMFLTEQQEPERGISELQKLSGIVKEYHSDDCLDYAKVQETLGTIYLMTANLPQAKTHFKRAFKIYEKIWADEPEMIEAKYQEIQELYPQIGFCIGKNLSGLLTK
ncbi:tetratricopeptide repeat protein, partial [Holdemanella biformis]|uniref:tetratricopeptide repeat protein n=1 Tax=Holdemanella biformis TaxID=1735 RepID=UPI003AB61DDB